MEDGVKAIKGIRKLMRSATLNAKATNPHPTQTAIRQRPRTATHSLNELVICAICLEQLRRPTMLPCQHTFCLLCLQDCAQKGKAPLITCPTCRLEVVIPSEGVSALPTNILIQAFLETIKPEGSPANSARSSLSRRPAPSTGDSSIKPKFGCNRCGAHEADPASLLPPCPHCTHVFCSSCHLMHETEIKSQWTKTLQDLAAEDLRLSLLKDESKARSKKLQENIQASIGIHVQQLCDKQEQLLAELKAWRKEEAARLADVQQLCQNVLTADESQPISAEMVKRAANILTQARLCGTARLTFDENELALTRESASVEHSTADSGGRAEDAEGQEEKEEDQQQQQQQQQASGANLLARRRSNRERQEHLSRRVTFNGSSNLMAGQSDETLERRKATLPPSPPPDSPLSADEQSFFYRSKSGQPKQRLTSANLQRPAGVAISPWTGELYVVSMDGQRVYVIDHKAGSGRIVKSLGSSYRSAREGGGEGSSSHNGTFLCPFGIAFSIIAEEILVTDKWLNCIQVFNKGGDHMRTIGAKGTSPGHFRSPEGIAVDQRTGHIYVADTCNDRIQVLDRHGTYLRELGIVSQMTLPGGKLYTKREFNEPTGVTVSSDGMRVAVCDFGNCRVKVFSVVTGERLLVFGYRGTQKGQFQHPESIVMDNKGFLIVSDSGNGRIQIFRPNGNFVRAIGSKGTGPGQFNWVSGLALNQEGDIIASDFKNHSVQVF